MESVEQKRDASLAEISQILDQIKASNANDATTAGLDILHKLVQNIAKNPTDEKFRTFKMSNKAIAAKVMSLQPNGSIVNLLKALGYVEVDSEIMAFTGNYFDVLFMGSRLIDDAAMEIKMLSMSPEDRKKQELIIQNRKELAEKRKAEAAYKA